MPEPILYEMCLLFDLDISLKSMNDILKQCGFSEKPIAQNAMEVTMTQTLPFIPDDDVIKKYEDVIKQNYETDSLICENCKFKGFKYIHVKKPD